ncbi:hypothetical protein JCM11491_001589 [Sporobolomyces phaffii]
MPHATDEEHAPPLPSDRSEEGTRRSLSIARWYLNNLTAWAVREQLEHVFYYTLATEVIPQNVKDQWHRQLVQDGYTGTQPHDGWLMLVNIVWRDLYRPPETGPELGTPAMFRDRYPSRFQPQSRAHVYDDDRGGPTEEVLARLAAIAARNASRRR